MLPVIERVRAHQVDASLSGRKPNDFTVSIAEATEIAAWWNAEVRPMQFLIRDDSISSPITWRDVEGASMFGVRITVNGFNLDPD